MPTLPVKSRSRVAISSRSWKCCGLPAIDAWTTQSGTANVRPPVLLDVMEAQWPSQGASFVEPFDAIYCAIMLHISPWATCAALMQGCARHLASHGVLITYGPYLQGDVPTAPGQRVVRSQPAPS